MISKLYSKDISTRLIWLTLFRDLIRHKYMSPLSNFRFMLPICYMKKSAIIFLAVWGNTNSFFAHFCLILYPPKIKNILFKFVSWAARAVCVSPMSPFLPTIKPGLEPFTGEICHIVSSIHRVFYVFLVSTWHVCSKFLTVLYINTIGAG